MGYFEDEADEEYWLEQAEELGEDLDVDTREGSVYMDAAAGHCMRTAKFYSDLSMVFEMLAVDTCGGDILSEKPQWMALYELRPQVHAGAQSLMELFQRADLSLW